MSTNRKTFLFIALPLIIFFLGIGGYYVLGQKQSPTSTETTSTTSEEEQSDSEEQGAITWSWSGTSWKASSTPPACPSPLELKTPVDLSLATSILYPGQTRGQYKPHGGFRFGTDNSIEVVAPMNATVVQASRYIEGGETQYLFEFVNDCGIAYRFDHLLTLSPKFQALADKLPAAKLDDSRTTQLEPTAVKAGDLIATAVGFQTSKNVAVDFGVYDYRSPNTASESSSYQTAHQNEGSLAFYGVCWLDLLGSTDSSKVKALPAGDSMSGKTSDYCR